MPRVGRADPPGDGGTRRATRLEGPSPVPRPLQRLPISAGRRLELERGQSNIRSPNKSQPKFRPVGASSRNYTQTHRGVKPEWRQFCARSSPACWKGKPRCHVTRPPSRSKATPPALLRQDAAGVLTTLEGLRSVLSFAFGSRADNPDEGVGSPPARSLGSRWLVLVVASIVGSTIPRRRNRCARFEVDASCDEPSISAAGCGHLRRHLSGRSPQYKKPQQVATEVSTRRGFRSELYPT